jgi:putative N6-adenine-specific DNA methylase
MVLNPPYGERIGIGRCGGLRGRPGRGFSPAHWPAPAPPKPVQTIRCAAVKLAHTDDGGEFFSQLASHWKKNFSGWHRLGAHARPQAARQACA